MSIRPLSYAEVEALKREQRIALRIAADGAVEALRSVRTIQARLRVANRGYPLPEGALDLDLDLTGVQKTLERIQRELAEMGKSPVREPVAEDIGDRCLPSSAHSAVSQGIGSTSLRMTEKEDGA